MKNFKEMLDKDLDRTFYNTEEFAELQRVRIDGIDRNVPVIFDSDAAEARRQVLPHRQQTATIHQRYLRM